MNAQQRLKQYIIENNQEGIKEILPAVLQSMSMATLISRFDDVLHISDRPNHDHVLSLYPHLDLQYQKMIMDRINIKDMKSNYFIHLKHSEGEDKHAIKKSLSLHKFIAHQFFEGNLKQIEEIQTFFDNNFLQERFHIYAVHNAATNSISIANSGHKVFCPYYNFIAYPDKEVANYLLSQNICVPSISEAETINSIVKNNVGNYERPFFENTLYNYKAFLLYQELSKDLPQKEVKTRKVKI